MDEHEKECGGNSSVLISCGNKGIMIEERMSVSVCLRIKMRKYVRVNENERE